ncbi:SurA N-terminal domain-containing protein [Nitratifractor sp.]
MIAWMQKHNKYLVITIWIATIAFIGAGFVGWGTYQYGSKAGAIAKVGDVTISQEKFNFTYQNLYRQVAQQLGGAFDDAKAKEMQLPRRAYNQLVMQAYLLNLAQEYGIVVSDEELAAEIAQIPSFQNKGAFDKKIYMTFLNGRRIKAKEFEAIVRDDLIIAKLMKLLNKKAVPFEKQVIASALSISDKIRYEVLTPDTIQPQADEVTLKQYWQKHKQEYKTPKKFKVAILWTPTDDINVTEEALKNFYRKNSFNYTDAEGKELGYEKAKAAVERDYRIKKGKKKALLDYIALKKGKKEAGEVKTLPLNDPLLSKALWEELQQSSVGTLIKPKPVGNRYATLKLLERIPPRLMSFEEAKAQLEKAWLAEARAQVLKSRAEALSKTPEKLTKESKYLSLTRPETLPPLDLLESSQAVQNLFTSNKKTGIISINKKYLVYTIVDQKIAESDVNVSNGFATAADRIKQGEFQQTLLKELSQKYPVQAFVKGF